MYRVELVTLVCVSLGILCLFFVSAPKEFPIGEVVEIREGGVQEVAVLLKEAQVIRSSEMFVLLTRLSDSDTSLKKGSYIFEEPVNIFVVLSRITGADFGVPPVRVVLPEGTTRVQMVDILEEQLDAFDAELFLELTRDDEGYLFPDTYFFLPRVTTGEVVKVLRDTFTERLESIGTFEKPVHDIVTMASIIVREAYQPKDQKMISGVLWQRLAIDMPLQVDAPFVFLIGKGSSELTREDLATTSPYNTYVHRGLPPGPIANPGLDALTAAANPIESEYLYYLSDTEGVTYFARTFEEHKANKRKYLY